MIRNQLQNRHKEYPAIDFLRPPFSFLSQNRLRTWGLGVAGSTKAAIVLSAALVGASDRGASIGEWSDHVDFISYSVVFRGVLPQNARISQDIAAPEIVDVFDRVSHSLCVCWVSDDQHQVVEYVDLEDIFEIFHGTGEGVWAGTEIWLRSKRHKLTGLVVGIGQSAHGCRDESSWIVGGYQSWCLVEEVIHVDNVAVPLIDGCFDCIGIRVHHCLKDATVLVLSLENSRC